MTFQIYLVTNCYCSGAGFLISSAASKLLAEKVPITRVIPHIEDMSVGMLAHDAGVEMKRDLAFDCDMVFKKDRKVPCGVANLRQVFWSIQVSVFQISENLISSRFQINTMSPKKRSKNLR